MTRYVDDLITRERYLNSEYFFKLYET